MESKKYGMSYGDFLDYIEKKDKENEKIKEEMFDKKIKVTKNEIKNE